MKYVIRRLLRTPAFTAITLLTLAIGIGATSAVFTVINGVLLKPLPFAQPDRLVGVWHTASGLGNVKQFEISPSMYFAYRELNRTFEDLGVYTTGSVGITGIGQPEQEQSLWVTESVLPVLGVKPARGRTFNHWDDTDGSPLTVIVTWGYWQRRFGGSASIVGQHIVVDGRDRQIIGVLPESFRFMNEHPTLLLPLQFNRSKIFLGNFSYQGVARLKPGVTVAQASADVARMIPLWLTMFPPPPGFGAKIFEDAKIGPNIHLFAEDVTGDVGNALWVIMGTIGGVLLIACANVANLLLVRAEGRQHELSIRTALGAGRRRIVRGLLAESLALGVLGGVLGLATAWGAVRLLIAIAPANLPRLDEISIDPSVIAFTGVVSILGGLLFGILPAWRYGGVRAGTGLREGGRGMSHSKDRLRARNVLVVVQVALALVLLIGSGLMIRTFQALNRVQPGFTNPEEVLTLKVSLPRAQVTEPEAVARMYNQILDKIAQVPGVRSVAYSTGITLDGNSSGDLIFVENQPVPEGKVPPVRRFKFVSPGYFSTMGNHLAAGRDFTWTDVYSYRPTAVITENMAREVWGTPAAAIGKRIREGNKSDWREVIGVIGNEYDKGVHQEPPTNVYMPLIMKNFWGDDVHIQRMVKFAIRSPRTGSAQFLNQVQQAIWSVTPNTPISNVRTLGDIYRKSMARTSFTLVMLSIAGAMALALGLIGIYGAISYSVSQRKREIGIRMALGARQGQVRRMFIRSGLGLAGIGVVCGLAAAAGLTRLMKSLLFGVGAADPTTWSAMAAAMVLAALAASYVPARRATNVDPVETLRAE